MAHIVKNQFMLVNEYSSASAGTASLSKVEHHLWQPDWKPHLSGIRGDFLSVYALFLANASQTLSLWPCCWWWLVRRGQRQDEKMGVEQELGRETLGWQNEGVRIKERWQEGRTHTAVFYPWHCWQIGLDHSQYGGCPMHCKGVKTSVLGVEQQHSQSLLTRHHWCPPAPKLWHLRSLQTVPTGWEAKSPLWESLT